jgi:protein tyrosine phosphatase (PTP) superfamily phosphohydrolase (DUF442 family)
VSLPSAGRLLLVGVGVVVGLIVVGNLVILGVSVWARRTGAPEALPALAGVENLEAVDGKLLRGAAPSLEGYRALAAGGVRVVVDLRAEEGAEAAAELVRSLGMRAVGLPVPDGHVPETAEVREFLRVAERADGLVFVHCGAGVGRTGVMAGAYLVATGQLEGRSAALRNLRVGVPSLEQVAFVACLRANRIGRPPSAVIALSRLVDAPRRIYGNLRWLAHGVGDRGLGAGRPRTGSRGGGDGAREGEQRSALLAGRDRAVHREPG